MLCLCCVLPLRDYNAVFMLCVNSTGFRDYNAVFMLYVIIALD